MSDKSTMTRPAPPGACYRARLSTDKATAERIAALAGETLDHDAAAAAYEDRNGRWTIELHFSGRPNRRALRAIVAVAAGAAAARELTFAPLRPRDWVQASLSRLKPVYAGHFVVHGRHHRSRIPPRRLAIEIEAALAFGTGHHGTTRGCLIALDWIARRGVGHTRRRRRLPLRPSRDAAARTRMLDLGTGSGVLAIAAAKALRRAVLATDRDRTAVETARKNVRANGVGPLVEVVHVSGALAHRLRMGGPYDLVLANILLDPLKRFAAPLRRLLAPGACIVLSGLLAPQANAARSIYGAQGLVLDRTIEADGWVTLILRRPRTAPAKSPPRPEPGRSRAANDRPQRTKGSSSSFA
jgi:ribosomal protein L11 methyltransferase